eukprot:TRINITY_DN569_c2_g1_i1.p1 TRINITY_DN569_c2_g1~~TRINITY_DN569_c2_g1_i1.p1  ORF type:complete len:666 (-),score=164.85 TRINITY_DN569_c2_g1_i1:109-2106(-)
MEPTQVVPTFSPNPIPPRSGSSILRQAGRITIGIGQSAPAHPEERNFDDEPGEYALVIHDHVKFPQDSIGYLPVLAGSVVRILDLSPEIISKEEDCFAGKLETVSEIWKVQYRQEIGLVDSSFVKRLLNFYQAKKAKALRDYISDDPHYLTFHKGDLIRILDKIEIEGTWIGVFNGRCAKVIQDTVEVIREAEPSSPVVPVVPGLLVSNSDADTTVADVFEEVLSPRDNSEANFVNYQRFSNLVIGNMAVPMALCSAIPVTSADGMAATLINLFEAKGKTFDLLQTVIRAEVKMTNSGSTLFRANSMASKILSSYTRMAGSDYLHSTLRPLVKWIGASSTSFEIDPAKIIGGDDLNENRKNLMEGADLYFDGIRRSISNCPAPFKVICRELRSSVIDKFPELTHAVIGGFFFLRFMGPAIISPEGFGVLQENTPSLQPEARRALVLVSKLLQNLANGKSFGSKEEYMIPMQEFITKHEDEIKQLFDELSETDLNEMKPLLDISDKEFRENLRFLHTQIVLYYPKVESELKRIVEEQGGDPDTSPVLLELKDLMDSLGPPPDEKTVKQNLDAIKKSKKQIQLEKASSKKFFLAGSSTSISPPPMPPQVRNYLNGSQPDINQDERKGSKIKTFLMRNTRNISSPSLIRDKSPRPEKKVQKKTLPEEE